MGFADYLSSLNLDPATAASLTEQYVDGGPVTPDEALRYGRMAAVSSAPVQPSDPNAPFGPPTAKQVVDSADMAGANAAIASAADGGASGPGAASNPSRQSGWTPDGAAARAVEGAREMALAKANPQGPAGSDGFPTYKDLNHSGGSSMQPAPVAPGRMVPGGWQNSTRGETRQLGMDPNELASGAMYRDQAMTKSNHAAQEHLEAAEQRGMADAVYAAAHTSATQRANDQMQRIETQRAQYVDQERAKLNTMAIAAQEKIDPDAAKGSIGAQLMATFAVALGQFGASLNGGTNTALQMVNANIDRRIAAQSANIANAGKAYDRENSLYKENLAEFGDKQRAALATKVAYLDQAKAMADQQYALAKNTTNLAQFNELQAGIATSRAKAEDDFAKLTHTQVATQGSQHYAPAHMVGGGASAGVKGMGNLYVPSLGGYVRTEGDAKTLNAKAAIRSIVNESNHKIYGLLEEAKGLNMAANGGMGDGRLLEIRTAIEAAKHKAIVDVNVEAGQGALSKDDKVVAEAKSAMTDIDPSFKTNAQIERMRRGLATVTDTNMTSARLEKEAYRVQEGEERYVQGPNGPEARAFLTGRNAVPTKKVEGVKDVIEPNKGVTK